MALDLYLTQKMDKQFVGFSLLFGLTMLTSEIWSMLEIWMLIPTVTGLPETQRAQVKTVHKL